ncbi:MAG: hypothetical protein QF371_01640 [Flavobacteriales bacterium]|nr:hypothetical protein [Flavobacteriales bacterium]
MAILSIALLIQSCTKDSGPIVILPEPIIDTFIPPPLPIDSPDVPSLATPIKHSLHLSDTITPPPPPAENDTVSFANDLLPVIEQKCWYCHPTSGNLNLGNAEAYNQLVNVESAGYAPAQRIVPYDTAASVMYHKIIGDDVFGMLMPPGGMELSESEKEDITKWILQGALNN